MGVPLGPQDFVFETESAANIASRKQNKAICWGKENRRAISLSAVPVNRWVGQVRCSI